MPPEYRMRAEEALDRYLPLDSLETNESAVEMLPDLPGRVRQAVENLELTLTRKNIPKERDEISQLLGGKITLWPKDPGYLEAEIAPQPKTLLAAVGGHQECQISLVAGAGFKTYLITVPLVEKAA